MYGLQDLIPGNYQIDLFDDKQETIKLYQAIDSVKNRFGEHYVRKASGVGKERLETCLMLHDRPMAGKQNIYSFCV